MWAPGQDSGLSGEAAAPAKFSEALHLQNLLERQALGCQVSHALVGAPLGTCCRASWEVGGGGSGPGRDAPGGRQQMGATPTTPSCFMVPPAPATDEAQHSAREEIPKPSRRAMTEEFGAGGLGLMTGDWSPDAPPVDSASRERFHSTPSTQPSHKRGYSLFPRMRMCCPESPYLFPAVLTASHTQSQPPGCSVTCSLNCRVNLQQTAGTITKPRRDKRETVRKTNTLN